MVQEALAELVEIRAGREIFCRHWILGDVGKASKLQTINLVCVHGTAASHEQFLPLWKALDSINKTKSGNLCIHCFAFDAIGCGNSPKLSDERAYQDSEQVKDLEILIEKFVNPKFKTFYLGHSYGPTWIYKYLRQPKQKEQQSTTPLILIATGLKCKELQVGGPALFKFAPLWLLNCIQPLLTSVFLKIGFSTWTRQNNHQLIAEARTANNQNDMQVCSYYYRAHDWLSKLDENNSPPPSLVLHGIEDEIIPIKCGQDLANHMKTGFVTISNASHMVLLEQPDEVAEHVFSFLQIHACK